MARLLLWIVLGLAAWWMLRSHRRVQPPPGARGDRAAPPASAETMVDCAACGLHFPASEAIRDGARLYCCTAHRDAGPQRGQ